MTNLTLILTLKIALLDPQKPVKSGQVGPHLGAISRPSDLGPLGPLKSSKIVMKFAHKMSEK